MTEMPAPPAPTRSAAARAVELRKVYGEGDASVEALRGVSVDLAAGEFTAIMGPSGSGKSTLLHCLAGLDTPTSGQVFVGDIDLTQLNDKRLTELRRDKVGFVFQAFNLVPTLNARENITLPLDIAGRDVDQAWFDEVVSTIGIEDRLTHRPSQLSGGQQQRVAGARAMVSRPEIVFADEPTGNLDSKSGAELLGLPPLGGQRSRTDDRDGHPRRQRRAPRRPRDLPGGRQRRRRDARAHRRSRPRPPEDPGGLTAVPRNPQEPPGAQAATDAHGAVHRPRRRVRGGHVRADRHDEQGVHGPVHAGLGRQRHHRSRRGRVHAESVRTRRWRR